MTESLTTVVALPALVIWIYLLAFHGRFWTTAIRMPQRQPPLPAWPSVVAVIPARDEADVIGETIEAHLSSTYPGLFKVVLVDDQSADGTADLARAAAKAASRGAEHLIVLDGADLPEGWTGKLWAINQGIEEADRVLPGTDYVLFTDADIVHGAGTLTALVTKAETDRLALVSLMARLDARGPWASILIPAFVFFFQKLYPFSRINRASHRLGGAAGGCMLVRRDALRASGGVEPIRRALIDDCAFGQLIKDGPPRRAIWLGLADSVYSRRDNRSLRSIWNMVARTAFAQLGFSSLLLVGTVFGMVLVYLAAPVLALSFPLHGDGIAALLGLGVWGAMAGSFMPMLAYYGKPRILGFALPVAASLYTLMTISSALRHWRGRGGAWKGRTYGSSFGGR